MTAFPQQLLTALQSRGPRPCLVWYEAGGRLELSGHVVANWIIKASNYLRDDLAVAEDTLVVLDMPPHWKRLVFAVAAWCLGARVESGSAARERADVLLTDSPATTDSAEEILALDPVSIALRFSGDLPPLAHDAVVDMRAHPDAPLLPLDAWSGPQVENAELGESVGIQGDGLAHDGLAGVTHEAAQLLATWLGTGVVVGPLDNLSARRRQLEGI